MVFEWAKDMASSDELIDEALATVENDKVSVSMKIANEIIGDEDDESDRLLMAYKSATDEQKCAIDATLVSLTGWSLRHILEDLLGKPMTE